MPNSAPATARGDRAAGAALALAGVLLACATACGAFGAHALRTRLPPDRLQLWDTGVRYHFFQALGLLGIGLTLRLPGNGTRREAAAALRTAALLNVAGVLLFSGSLYALALGAPRSVGVLTPIGGLAAIAAWLVFGWAVWRTPT